MKSKSISDFQLGIAAAIVLVFWLILSSFNRLVDDDLIMVNCIKRDGVWGTMLDFYRHWNTRWASYLFQGCWYSSWTNQSSTLFFNLFTLVFMVLSCSILIGSCIKKFQLIQLNYQQIISYSLILFGGIIAATYHIGDTWFWVSGSTMYGWNLGCGLLLFAFLMKSPKFAHLIVLIPSALFIGGAGEPFVIGLIVFPVFMLATPLKNQIKLNLNYRLTWLALCISFGIAFLGDGHSVRSNLLPVYSFQDYLLRSGYFSLKLLGYHSPLRIAATFFILLPFYTIGSYNFHQNKLTWMEFIKKKLLPIKIIWAAWLIFHVILITKIMGNYGPPRAWSSISLITALLTAYLLFEAGRNQLIKKEVLLKKIYYFTILACVLYTGYQYFQINRYYSITDHSNNTEQLINENIEPGVLHKQEMK